MPRSMPLQRWLWSSAAPGKLGSSTCPTMAPRTGPCWMPRLSVVWSSVSSLSARPAVGRNRTRPMLAPTLTLVSGATSSWPRALMLVAVLLRNHNGAATSAPPSAGNTRGSAARCASVGDAALALCDCPTDRSSLTPRPLKPAPISPRCIPSATPAGPRQAGSKAAPGKAFAQVGSNGDQRVSLTLACAVRPGLVTRRSPAPAECVWPSSETAGAVGTAVAAWPLADTDKVVSLLRQTGVLAVSFFACATCTGGITGIDVGGGGVWPNAHNGRAKPKPPSKPLANNRRMSIRNESGTNVPQSSHDSSKHHRLWVRLYPIELHFANNCWTGRCGIPPTPPEGLGGRV